MGGHALKQYETRRYLAAEYFSFTEKFSDKFTNIFGFAPVLIDAYRNKESFGDADFLVDASRLPANWTTLLKTGYDLTPEQYVKNSNVVSIGVEHFQVDLIVTAHEDMLTSKFYFAFNDFGNLIGRIGHKLGVKIGHQGLSLVVRHKERTDHIIKEIFISKNPYDALDLLGLSQERYNAGFDDLTDLFTYVVSSKYFDSAIYALDNRSATSRVRDKKRPTYNAFLKWVVDNNVQSNHSFANKSELGGYSIRMPYYETEVLARWPETKQIVDKLIAEVELDIRFKEVYNGDIVSTLTNFTGKVLGGFMKLMKPKITSELKQEWIANPALVTASIMELFFEVDGAEFSNNF